MADLTRTVTADDTARAVGSGDLDVLGTPVVIAWCEAATMAALELEPQLTSVGTHVDVRHLAPSPVGAMIEVHAEVTERTERSATFAVEARDGGTVVASGTVVRAVVDRERFLARL
ncbi:hotdog domain-containing protein [Aeromicrobium sp.]|uniref:thioesterase family protein n=1 Tax=Aeromicrobium sp. TaxID=1871063 RepID=UPI0025BF7492|nr:hotdog domain-containing protein [Aeromicrobium sp.]MCK5891896.1 thioesterase [Aeromicrobium sp.]